MHGGARAAAEIVFGVLAPSWRLDPKAVVVLAPVQQAALALRTGRVQMASLRGAAGAATRHPRSSRGARSCRTPEFG